MCHKIWENGGISSIFDLRQSIFSILKVSIENNIRYDFYVFNILRFQKIARRRKLDHHKYYQIYGSKFIVPIDISIKLVEV